MGGEVSVVVKGSSGGEELMKSTMNWSMGEMGSSVVGLVVDSPFVVVLGGFAVVLLVVGLWVEGFLVDGRLLGGLRVGFFVVGLLVVVLLVVVVAGRRFLVVVAWVVLSVVVVIVVGLEVVVLGLVVVAVVVVASIWEVDVSVTSSAMVVLCWGASVRVLTDGSSYLTVAME